MFSIFISVKFLKNIIISLILQCIIKLGDHLHHHFPLQINFPCWFIPLLHLHRFPQVLHHYLIISVILVASKAFKVEPPLTST
jgi:hypothetical protein